MKIRNGFVSNSSSSSFILIVDKEDHEKALALCDPYIKVVFDQEIFLRNKKILGKDRLIAMGTVYSEDFMCDYEGEKPEKYEFADLYEVTREYEDALASLDAEYLFEIRSS